MAENNKPQEKSPRADNPRSWLTDSEFIAALNYHDKEYLTELLRETLYWLNKIPIKLYCDWDETPGIRFRMGNKEQIFRISPNYHQRTYLEMVEQWAKRFYPRYTVTKKEEIPLTLEEQRYYLDMGEDIDKVLSMTKNDLKSEYGIITRIFMKEDLFTFVLNDKRTIRFSNIMPLSKFMDIVRSLHDYDERREFIMANSIWQSDIKDSIKDIEYTGTRLMNFFRVHARELIKYSPGTDLGNDYWQFGRFKVCFQGNDILREDCLSALYYNGTPQGDP